MAEGREKICPECGARNTDEVASCLACGASLGSPPERATRADTEPLPSETKPSGRPVTPQSGGSRPITQFMLSDRYRLVYEIARGGMGVIYLAEDTLLDNLRIAIKLLTSQLAPELQAEKRLKREALTAMSLSHENIVRLYSFDQYQGQNYLVMEYVNGPTLMDLVTDRGPMSPAEVVHYIAAVCDGLHYAHEKGIVHRDIKPANLMLALPYNSPFVPPLAARGSTPEGAWGAETSVVGKETDAAPPEKKGIRPMAALAKMPGRGEPLSKMSFEEGRNSRIKICDFGIARQLQENYTRLTGTNIIGSPVYMSPEQYRGEDLDRRSDIYSLGATAYEMLAGCPPFDGPIHSLTYQILDKPAKEIKGLSDELNRVLMKSLSKSQEDRWQTCQEFARVLRRAVGDDAQAVKPVAQGRPVEVAAAREAPAEPRGAEGDIRMETRIARISFEAKLYDKALQELRDIRARQGPKPELLSFARDCATQLVNRKKLDEAKSFCNIALQMEPRHTGVLLALGKIERMKGNADEAERNLRLALKYGGDSEAEKELREVLSTSRSVGEAGPGLMSRFAEVTHLTFPMAAGYAALLVAGGAAVFVVSFMLFNAVGGEFIAAVVSAGAFLALSAFLNTALVAAVTGPIALFKDRMLRVKQFSTAQGYTGGWLMIAAVSAGLWVLYNQIMSGAGFFDVGPNFVLVFGLPCWVMSIPFSWFVVSRALRSPSPFD